jgi:hypothetical protein
MKHLIEVLNILNWKGKMILLVVIIPMMILNVVKRVCKYFAKFINAFEDVVAEFVGDYRK